ncbi:glycosyltransferase family 4 protein [bacterium]|nr:glycosyltransferase family 4 protein [bacterium]
MKVLHIGLDCTHGGAESFLATLIREQRKVGIEADVFFRNDFGAASQFQNVCRVMFVKHNLLVDVLLKEKYDIIHVTSHAASWVRKLLFCSLYRGPIVETSHAMGSCDDLLHADYVIAVSRAVANSIENKCTSKLEVIYNGIDTSIFFPPANKSIQKPILGWVGRSNDGVKDFAGLVAISLHSSARNFQVIVADGSPANHESGNWLPRSAQVNYRMPWTEMPNFYRSIAASGGFLLSTSRLEACPMNMIEAQACGCPVIAPSVGGIPEIVKHMQTGFIYSRDGGVEAIADGIDWLYQDYETVSENAINHVLENHTAAAMCNQYSAIYEDAIKSHRITGLTRFGRMMLRSAMPCVKHVYSAISH